MDLEPLIIRLAAEFKKRGMEQHLELLRQYFKGYRARRRAALREKKTPPWTEDMVIDWLLTMQIPPFENHYPVLDRTAPCPMCKTPARGMYPTTSSTVWRGGSRVECMKCKTAWLVLEEER